MTPSDDILRNHFRAIEAGDYDLLRDLLHPQCELVVSGLVVRGADNFIRAMRAQGEAVKAALDDVKYSIRDMVRKDDTIVCENRLTGTFSRALHTAVGDYEPTHRRVVIDGCDYVKLDDGKVKSWHAYVDGLTGAAAFGFIKPKQDVDVEGLLGLS